MQTLTGHKNIAIAPQLTFYSYQIDLQNDHLKRMKNVSQFGQI